MTWGSDGLSDQLNTSTAYINPITGKSSYRGVVSSPLSSSKILIDGKEYKAIKTINLTKEATICKRRVEDQTEIADHIIESPPVLEFDLELFNVDTEYASLNTLYKEKIPFQIVSHRGTFERMVISKLSDRKSLQANTTTASVTVQQILIGKVITSPGVSEKISALVESAKPSVGSISLQSAYWSEVNYLPPRGQNETAKEYIDNSVIPADASNQVQGLVASMNTRRP